MKKLTIIFTAILSVLLVSCKQNEEIAQLEITAANTLFTHAGGEGYIEFLSSSEVTSVTSSVDWIIAYGRKNDVMLEVAENTEISSRTATITLRNEEGISADVTIEQKGAKFQFEGKDITVGSDRAEVDLEYYALDKMSVLIPEEAQSWLSAIVSGNSLLLIVSENPDVKDRSTTVKYAISSKTGSFKVTQTAAAAYIRNFDPKDIEAPKEGLEVSYSFNTNSTLTVKASDKWITAKVENGALNIRVEQNYIDEPREGKIDWTLAKSDIKGTITVKQEKGYVVRTLEVKDSEGEKVTGIETGWTGGKETVTVRTNTPWTVSTTADWIKINPTSSTSKPIEPEDQTVTITIDPISATSDGNGREAEITFNAPDAENGPSVIKISQTGFTSIAIDVTDVTYSTVNAVFTPSDEEVLYIFGLVDKADNMTDAQIASADYADIMELVEEYASQFSKDEILGMLLSQGPDEYEFTDLDEETEYQVYAYAVDMDLNVLGPIFRKDVKTGQNPWKYLGKGKYTDGFISSVFDVGVKSCAVDIYESKTNPGHYAVDTPYGPEMLAGWLLNASASVLKNYEGTYWKHVMFEIHAEEPSQVFIMMQELGACASSTYGWFYGGTSFIEDGKLMTYTGCVGTLAGGKITFPIQGLRSRMSAYPSLFFGNYDASDFCVELPAASSSAAMTPMAAKKQMSRAEKIVFAAAHPVTFKTSAKAPGWSVRVDE